MRKAQLTMFIILGIVIITIFGFVFFATGQVAQKQVEQQADKIVSDLLETTSLNFYVSKCTEKALENGIDILSKQGGKIFPGQPGSIMTQDDPKSYLYSINGKTYKVAYAVLRGGVLVPQYPCTVGFEGFDVPPAFCVYRQSTKFNNLDFGVLNMPSICKNRFGGCTRAEGWNPQFSLQAELEAYVSDYVKKCVDFESIVGKQFAVHEGNASSNVTFSDNDVTAVVTFPILVAPPAQQPVVKLISFQSSIPTRFKLVYSVARDIVTRDVNQGRGAPTFNITRDFFTKIIQPRFFGSRNPSNDPGIVLEKKEHASGYDALYKLTDTFAKPGTELSLQFLIENRPPVLEYIDPHGPYGKEPPAGCGVYDIIQIQNSLLTIEPKFFDTEEDGLTLSYTGWLQDYNETVLAHRNVDYPIIDSDQKTSFGIPPSPTKTRWIKDPLVKGKVAAYVYDADVGPHIFTIKVCDSQYCDYQNVRVLIDDFLKVFVNKSNPYGTKEFSLEDPYTLTARITDVYNPQGYAFAWHIKDYPSETELYANPAGEQDLKLPFGTYDISNIKAKYNEIQYNGQPLFKLAPNQYEFVADVVTAGNPSVTNKTIVQPQQCIYYLNPTVHPAPPFPYNKTDPFLADHACCNVDDTIKTSGTCYTPNTYGSYNSFNKNKYKTQYDSTSLPDPDFIQTTFSSDLTSISGATKDYLHKIKADLASPGIIYKNTNDIFNRSFVRNCDNKRGNTCTGIMTETYRVQKECLDKDPTKEIASCEGPSTLLLQQNSEVNQPSQAACIKYDSTTFEHEADPARHPGIQCNLNAKCTTRNNDPNGFSDKVIIPDVAAGIPKHYFCNATCSGDLGCAKTFTTLCHDCYKDQSCIVMPPRTASIPQTIKFAKFDSCSDTPTAKCNVPQGQLTDSCIGIVLHKFDCAANPTTSDSPYSESTQDCSQLVIAAVDSDGGKDYTQEGTCTYHDWTQNQCTSGKCVPGQSITVRDGAYFDQAQNKYFYREWYAGHDPSAPGGTQESCLSDEVYDYDLLYPDKVSVSQAQFYCENAIFRDASGQPKAGVWKGGTSNPCCGDDANEWGTC